MYVIELIETELDVYVDFDCITYEAPSIFSLKSKYFPLSTSQKEKPNKTFYFFRFFRFYFIFTFYTASVLRRKY